MAFLNFLKMENLNRRDFLGLTVAIITGCAIPKNLTDDVRKNVEKTMLSEQGSEFCAIAFREFEKLGGEFEAELDKPMEEETERFNRMFKQRLMALDKDIVDIEFVPDELKTSYRIKALFKGQQDFTLMAKINWDIAKIKLAEGTFFDASLSIVQAFKQPNVLILNKKFRFLGKKKKADLDCYKGKCTS